MWFKIIEEFSKQKQFSSEIADDMKMMLPSILSQHTMKYPKQRYYPHNCDCTYKILSKCFDIINTKGRMEESTDKLPSLTQLICQNGHLICN